MTNSLRSIAKMIDHSLLHPALTDAELRAGCRLARELDVAAVCIKPYAVPLAVEMLAGSDVKVGTVVGFPHGSQRSEVKLYEAERALADGAVELDMVVNIGKVLSEDWNYVAEEINQLNTLTVGCGGLLKVIFENGCLPDDNYKTRLADICNSVAPAFVKTSTGYCFVKQADGRYIAAGAVDADVVLMRRVCRPEIMIKAAGGIRTLDDVLRLQALGAARIGTTSTADILAEARRRGYA